MLRNVIAGVDCGRCWLICQGSFVHVTKRDSGRGLRSSLVDVPLGLFGVTRRRVGGHPPARALGGVDAVDRVVAGSAGGVVLLFCVGVGLFLSLGLFAMCESVCVAGRILDS